MVDSHASNLYNQKMKGNRTMSVYQKLKDAGCKMDSHESDLYVENTEVSQAIIKECGHKLRLFRSCIDQALWISIPSQYEPYWNRKRK